MPASEKPTQKPTFDGNHWAATPSVGQAMVIEGK